MIEGSLAAFGINIIYLVMTLFVMRTAIWYINRSHGVKLGEILKRTVYTDPMATAVYRGAVWIGACMVAAAFLR